MMTNEEQAISFIDAAIKQLEGALRNVVDIRLHDESITELMRVKFKLEKVHYGDALTPGLREGK